MTGSSPAVTFALICYNHERFVRAAVRSALSQEFEPLEIVISDDCSTDATFDIIEEEVAAYDGPHTVSSFRNPENLGGGNWAKTVGAGSGEFIVIGHGDDIALPQRTRRLVETWRDTKASLVTSDVEIIDAESVVSGTYNVANGSRWVSAEDIARLGWQRTMLGSTMAFHRDVFSRFRPLTSDRLPMAYDHVLPFRASILGGVYYLGEALMQWRQHEGNQTKYVADGTQSAMVKKETMMAYDITARICMLEDLEDFVESGGTGAELETLTSVLAARILDMSKEWTAVRNCLVNARQQATWIGQADFEKRLAAVDLDAKPVSNAVWRRLLRTARAVLKGRESAT